MTTADSELPLHVEVHEARPGAGPETLVLVHGYGGCSFTWRHWVRPLAERGRVLLVDLKGAGRAPKPLDGRYSPLDQAELLHRLIRARDLHDVTLVGHSLGGGVTLLLALRLFAEEPGRVRRLVLLGSPAYRQRLPPFVTLARWPRLSAGVMRLLGARRVVALAMRQIVHDPGCVTDEAVEGYARWLGSAEARRALIDTALQILPADLESIQHGYRRLDVPALLLWGREDRVVPLWVGERLAAELPRARLHVLERCGHVPPEERPQESLESVLRFLDES